MVSEILRVLLFQACRILRIRGRIEDAYHSHCSLALSVYSSYAVGQLEKVLLNNY